MSEDLEMYLDALRENISPFDRFVSRGDKPDAIDVAEPRRKATKTIERALRAVVADGTPRLVPILGEAGSGKTHLFWVLYDQFDVRKQQIDDKNVTVVYTPSPPAPVRVPLHVWTSVLDDIGTDLLKNVSRNLLKRYGVQKGFLRKIDEEETIARAVREFPGLATDVIKALVIYGARKDKERTEIAERYLLGEILTEEQMDSLGLRTAIEDDDIVFAAMKTILGLYSKVVVIYFDELEIPYRIHGSEASSSFIENLKRLYNEISNILIVTACLDEVWPKILETLDQAMRTRMEIESSINPFSKADLHVLYEDNMRYYWENTINIEPPSNPVFPLREEHFDSIHLKSKGNPRQAIKMIRAYLDAIIDAEELPSELPTPTAQRALSRIQKAESTVLLEKKPVVSAGDTAGISVSTEEQTIDIEEDLTIVVNPQYVATGIVDSFKAIASQNDRELDIQLEYKFEHNKREHKLAALIAVKKDPSKKIILEVPAVKDFDKKGGVAAYYALSRVKSALDSGVAPKAIVVVPAGTAGAKYLKLKEELGAKLVLLEIDNDSGEELIRGGLTKTPSVIGRKAAKTLFPHIE
ncbi:MAG: hypothetical protein ACFFD4_15810 [Candidatus Odinarchaeota archaeon]